MRKIIYFMLFHNKKRLQLMLFQVHCGLRTSFLKWLVGFECLFKRVKSPFFTVFLNKFLKHVFHIILELNNHPWKKYIISFLWKKKQISGFTVVKKAPSPWKKIFLKRKSFQIICIDSLIPSFSSFTSSKRIQNSFTAIRHILDVVFIVTFISIVIYPVYTSLFTFTYLYLFTLTSLYFCFFYTIIWTWQNW